MWLVNGQEAQQLALSDRAIQFGDGVFRTIRIEKARPLFWSKHYAKLQSDCLALGITPPQSITLQNEVDQLVVQSGLQQAALKIIISRGQTLRGYLAPPELETTRIVQLGPLPCYPDTLYQQGASVILCQTRASWQPALAGIKHLNRLENVMARREWSDPAILEGLMCDQAGHIVEGVMSNVLVQSGNYLLTPSLKHSGVAGVMRQLVMQAAQNIHLHVEETNLSLETLLQADHVWICNSLLELVPVAKMNDHHWKVLPKHPLSAELACIKSEELCR